MCLILRWNLKTSCRCHLSRLPVSLQFCLAHHSWYHKSYVASHCFWLVQWPSLSCWWIRRRMQQYSHLISLQSNPVQNDVYKEFGNFQSCLQNSSEASPQAVSEQGKCRLFAHIPPSNLSEQWIGIYFERKVIQVSLSFEMTSFCFCCSTLWGMCLGFKLLIFCL